MYHLTEPYAFPYKVSVYLYIYIYIDFLIKVITCNCNNITFALFHLQLILLLRHTNYKTLVIMKKSFFMLLDLELMNIYTCTS